MTLPLPPGPDGWWDPDRWQPPGRGRRPTGAPLTQRECAALDDIADDLAVTDPELLAQLSRRGGVRGWWPISARATMLLVLGLLLLVGIAQALPSADWVVLGAATVLVVVPWMVLAVRPRPDSGNGPARSRPRS